MQETELLKRLSGARLTKEDVFIIESNSQGFQGLKPGSSTLTVNLIERPKLPPHLGRQDRVQCNLGPGPMQHGGDLDLRPQALQV